MGLPMGQKLVKSGSTWARLCGTLIFETAGWICTIQSSMELSRTVVVQHLGHLTLTLDFQGQILKMLYLRNGRADWHGTKGMSQYDARPTLWLWTVTSPMTLTLDFQGQILKMLYLKNGRADWHGTKGMWVDRVLDPHCDFELWPHQWPWSLIFKVKFLKSHNSGMGCPIDMEQKGCESIGC